MEAVSYTHLDVYKRQGINDGAAAVVVMSEEKAKELGVKPLATWEMCIRDRLWCEQ